MDGKDIPGFYYDAEKKKYFKVVPKQYAPDGAKYTIENMRKEKEESKKRKRLEGMAESRSRYLVQTSNTLRNAISTGSGIQNEIGSRSRGQRVDARAKAFVNGLEENTCLNLKEDAMSNVALLPQLGKYEIRGFDYDSDTEGLILAVSSGSDWLVTVLPNEEPTWPSWCVSSPDDDWVYRVHYSYHQIRPVMHLTSAVSSVNLSPSRTLITTTTGGKQSPVVHLTQLLDSVNAVSSQPLDTGISTLLRPKKAATIWAGSPNPWRTAASETIAIGCDHGIVNLSNASGTWRSSGPVATHSDVLSLDWLSPNTLAAGLRDASVVLYDARSQGSVKRLRHGGPVIGLKRADQESRLIACGLSHSLAMYDLRMLREGESSDAEIATKGSRNSEKQKKQRKARQSKTLGRQISRPLLQFEYQNEAILPLGLDVQTEFGLVAAAEDTGEVQVYSMLTGETIRTFKISGGWEAVENVKCVRFVGDVNGIPKLMASAGSKIVEYCW